MLVTAVALLTLPSLRAEMIPYKNTNTKVPQDCFKIRMMTAVAFKGRTRRRKEDDRRRAGSTIKGITHVTTLQTVAVSSVCDANKNTNDIP